MQNWLVAIILVCNFSDGECTPRRNAYVAVGPMSMNEIACYRSGLEFMAGSVVPVKEGQYMRWGCIRLPELQASDSEKK